VSDEVGLSREELLALIGDLRASLDAKDARLDALLVQVGELTAQVQALVLRLGKDSQSSSKPPSSDGPNRRPRGGSSRTKSGLKPGKQPGAEGKTLQLVADPDETISIPAPSVCACGTHLVETPVVSVRRRQVTDIPEAPAPFVTEYAADVKTCPGCSKPAVGDFPEGVDAPVQYGPEVHAKAADITLAHHVPIHRSTILLMELCGISVSTGFMASLRGKAARILEATFMPAVQALLATAPVAHADETFTRTAGHTVYLHVVCTEYLTLMHAGDRSGATIDAGGVLTKLTGVLVRDGYVGYKHLANVLHAWCSAHLLRDLRGIHEGDPEGQLWAKAMADTLIEANRIATVARTEGRDELSVAELDVIARLYTGALARARTDNPTTKTTILAGHARTLAARFETYREMILRFTTDLAVPWTNNLAERQVRPAKVQQRASGGCWRTLQGLTDYAITQSYLSTARQWGITRIDALRQLFTTGPWIPPALTPAAATAA